MYVLCSFKIKVESENSEYWGIKDQWPYANQDQDAKLQSGTSNVLQSPSQDFNDMDVLYIFKIILDCKTSENWFIKDQFP